MPPPVVILPPGPDLDPLYLALAASTKLKARHCLRGLDVVFKPSSKVLQVGGIIVLLSVVGE